MAEEEYKVVPIHFKGKVRALVCHKGKECSALIAISNLVNLLVVDDLDPEDLLETKNQQKLIDDLVEAVEETVDDILRSSSRRKRRVKGKKERLAEIARSLDALTVLDPVNLSCQEFSSSDEKLLFDSLDIRVLHGWLLDPKEKDLSFVHGASYSTFADKIAEAERMAPTASGGNPLIKRLNDFMNASITAHGLSRLHKTVKEDELAILYAKNQYNVLYKHDGELFILEAAEENVTQLPNAMWKKLSVEEEKSFHVTARFSPTKDQQKEKKKIAYDWWSRKITALDDEPTRSMKSKLTLS